MQSCDASSFSRDEDWPEPKIEKLQTPKIRLTETALKVFTVMRGPPQGDLGLLYESVGHRLRQGSDVSNGTLASMPDRHFHQTILPDQVTPTFATFATNTVGITESEAFEYFGFLKINGKWVDPDNEMAIYKASKNHPDVTNPILPGMDCSSGPYILSKSEQSLVYDEFLDDDDDDEGDPRTCRISPETFAKWAEGAVKVEQPQHEVIKQVIQIQRCPRQRSKERATLTVRTPKYCAETGDCLTDGYSIDEDPVPLLSPQSINMDRLPMMFSRAYPLDTLRLNRDHCFDGHVVDGIQAPSSPECITSERVREALNVDWDPDSGIRQMNEIRDHVDNLWKDCHNIIETRSLAEKFLTDLEKEVDQLRTSTYFLRKQATNMVEQANQASRRRRIREHLGNYIEALTHKRARLEVGAQKIHKKNEALLEERNRLRTEQLNLQNTVMTLHETEELDPFYDDTDDDVTGYFITDDEEQTHG